MQKILIAILALFMGQTSSSWTPKAVKIWDNNNYSAFTSLVSFNGKYYCAFREAGSHIYETDGSARGKVRVLVSRTGRKWKSAAVIAAEGRDLRDPKLSVMPDGRLMLIMGGSRYANWEYLGRTTYVSFSFDGTIWTTPRKVNIDGLAGDSDIWIWRATWYEGKGFGVGYDSDSDNLHLLSTQDGVTWNHVSDFACGDYPNETTVRFTSGGEMVMVVRCDGETDSRAYWGTSSFPYASVKLHALDFRIGGPDMLLLEDGRVILAGRSYSDGGLCMTSVWVGSVDGQFRKVLDLPSGPYGDTSYPGLMLKGGKLWITWYASTDPGTSDIWLAKIPLSKIL